MFSRDLRMIMHDFLIKIHHQKRIWITTLMLLFWMKVGYCIAPPPDNGIYLFDVALFEANLGWENFNASDRMSSPLQSPQFFNASFNASGLHLAGSFIDLKRTPTPSWFWGGRIGGQLVSNLKQSVDVPSSAVEQINEIYSLQREGGVFADIMLVYTSTKQKTYLSGFAGLEYEKYKLTGYEVFATSLPVESRNSFYWTPAARAGIAAGKRLYQNYILGIEYAHTFAQTTNLPGNITDSRHHSINTSADSLDLVFEVLLL